MARVPGTFKTRREWVLVDNPTYAGRTPSPLKAACHDGSLFITVECPNDRCDYVGHMHESQVAQVPADGEVASKCAKCSLLFVFPAGFFPAAFRELRDRGWAE